MMETSVTIFTGIFSVVLETFMMWYLCEFLLVRKPFEKHTIAIILSLVMGLSLGNTLFMPNKYLLLIVSIAISALIPLVMYKGNLLLRLFIVCLYFAIVVGMERATKYLLAFLYGGTDDLFTNSFKVVQGTVISKFLALILVRILATFKKSAEHILSVKTLFMLMIFPIASILCMIQLMDAGYLIERPHAYLRIFLTICLLILANVIVFYAFESLAQQERDKRKLLLAQAQYGQQVWFYKRLSEEKQLTNQMRHDLKHTLLVLSGYLQEGRSQEVLEHIQKMQEDLQAVRVETTGVLAWDIVIADKQQQAACSDSVLQVTTLITGAILVNEIDVAILLANALDNALEASEDIANAFIELDIKSNDERMNINLSNPIAHKVRIRNNFIATTKSDKGLHGIGLSSMQRIVDKYNGHMAFDVQDERFILNVELNNEAPLQL